MIVLVSGGRDFADRSFVFTILDRVERQRGTIHGVVQGKARGVDQLAEDWQHERIARIPGNPAQLWTAGYAITKAAWKLHGGAAGPIRNQHMLDENPGIGLLVAFPGGRGTNDMVKRAKAKGIDVIGPKDMGEILVHVDAPNFCAGLVLRDGIVVEAAPILRRSLLGKGWPRVYALHQPGTTVGWQALEGGAP